MFVINFYKTLTFLFYFVMILFFFYVLRGERHKMEAKIYIFTLIFNVGGLQSPNGANHRWKK